MGRIECEIEVCHVDSKGESRVIPCGSTYGDMYNCDMCGKDCCEKHVTISRHCAYCEAAQADGRSLCRFHAWYDSEDIAYCRDCQDNEADNFKDQEHLLPEDCNEEKCPTCRPTVEMTDCEGQSLLPLEATP